MISLSPLNKEIVGIEEPRKLNVNNNKHLCSDSQYSRVSRLLPSLLLAQALKMDQAPTASSTPKRTRKPNWTVEESKYLLELYKENAHTLRSNFSVQGCTHQTKKNGLGQLELYLSKHFLRAKGPWRNSRSDGTPSHELRPKLCKVIKDLTLKGKKIVFPEKW